MPQSLSYYSDFCAGLTNEIDMTFQVLCVGSDGIVLASDRLFRTPGLRGMTERHRQSYQPTLGTKLYVSRDNLTVCAFAGSPYSEPIARRIVTTCSPSGLSESDWRNILESAIKEFTEYDGQSPDEFLVVRVDEVSALKFSRQSGVLGSPTPIEDGCMWSGRENDAIIVPKLFWFSGMNCEQLRTLALLSIVQASVEAPHLIGGGIDILTVNKERRIEPLITYTEAQAKGIRDKFVRKVLEEFSS